MTLAQTASPLPCPICEAGMTLEENILAGELINCVECGSDLEVIADQGKITLAAAPEVEEDWGE